MSKNILTYLDLEQSVFRWTTRSSSPFLEQREIYTKKLFDLFLQNNPWKYWYTSWFIIYIMFIIAISISRNKNFDDSDANWDDKLVD